MSTGFLMEHVLLLASAAPLSLDFFSSSPRLSTMRNDSSFRPPISLFLKIYAHSLRNLLCLRPTFHLYTNNSQIYISHPNTFPEFQTQIFNYLPTPLGCVRHLKTYVQNLIYFLYHAPFKHAIL